MSEQPQSIGMMEGAFFVPKGDLMSWVNDLLKVELTKIEQLGTGAVYCQIVDVMFPGKVALQRVNWKARNQWEFINNFKVLQQSFGRCKIQKHIDIEKLSKSKYQDNLEFIQWMKRYYDLYNKNTELYDAEAARKGAQVDFGFVNFRNPLKKRQSEKLEQSLKSRGKSKSPYDKVKPRINNRSVTLGKNYRQQKSEVYIEKLTKIRDVLKKSPSKDDAALNQIKEIMEEIEEDLPKIEEQIEIQEKLQTVPSKPLIKAPSNKKREKENKKVK